MEDTAGMGVHAHGILLVDKAAGYTSHDVVAKARRALGSRKVGHAGTLDPMATGLLLLGVGTATRLLTHLVGLDKTYTATVRLGAATVTDDREGNVLHTADPAQLRAVAQDQKQIQAAVAQLVGDIEQVPSAVSAIKVNGRRAYQWVRAGEQVQLNARPVTVRSFEITQLRQLRVPESEYSGAFDAVDLEVTVRCSSGTYVRALARDLGAALGVGGHLSALRRTEIGPFSVKDARTIHSGIELLPAAKVAAKLFPTLTLHTQQRIDLGHGKRPMLRPGQRLSDGSDEASIAAAIATDGSLLGLIKVARGRAQVITNFPTDRGNT